MFAALTTPGNMHSKWLRILLTSCAILQFVVNLSYADPASDPSKDFETIWFELLSRYSFSNDCVNFGKWRSNSDDIKKLDSALEFLGQDAYESNIHTKVDLALLINAYNACSIRKILRHYPVDAVNSIAKFFTEKDCTVTRKEYSLNELETKLRNEGGFRIHASLWSGSKSAPPLKMGGFRSDEIEGQLDQQMRLWLSSEKWNELNCDDGEIRISKIFLWYKEDFGNDDDKMMSILFQYGPSGAWREKVKDGRCKVEYMDFDQSVNKACSEM